MHALAAILPYAVGVAIVAVVASLFGGLFSMAKGGAFNARWGNRLMRARVVSQGCAIVMIVLYVIVLKAG
jgi:hypothetical protein